VGWWPSDALPDPDSDQVELDALARAAIMGQASSSTSPGSSLAPAE
jgi:hypothetical protein